MSDHLSGFSHPLLVNLVRSTLTPSTTRIFSEQKGYYCVASSGHSTAVRVSASPLRLYRRHLCIYNRVAQSLLCHPSTQGLRSADWVFVIKLPLPVSSLRPACRRVFYRIASSLSSSTTWLGPPPLYARLDLANPTMPRRSSGLIASTSAATLPFSPCL